MKKTLKDLANFIRGFPAQTIANYKNASSVGAVMVSVPDLDFFIGLYELAQEVTAEEP